MNIISCIWGPLFFIQETKVGSFVNLIKPLIIDSSKQVAISLNIERRL